MLVPFERFISLPCDSSKMRHKLRVFRFRRRGYTVKPLDHAPIFTLLRAKNVPERSGR